MEAPLSLPVTGDRAVTYSALQPQLEALLDQETDAISAMANMSAVLHAAFGWHWVGFYRVIGEELVLGPFQGPVACSRIPFGKGVSGKAWKENRTVVVADVGQFLGHIACSPLSRSEIVVPLRDTKDRVVGVLDIDSIALNDFSTMDAAALENLVRLIVVAG